MSRVDGDRNPGSYIVRTLGCKANLSESQTIEGELQRRGWRPWTPDSPCAPPGLCVVNTCTVTDEADRQSRRLAARLGREHPGALVVVTGCSAEVDPERLARSPGIHYVIGNRDKPRMIELILDHVRDHARDHARDHVGDPPADGALSGKGEVLGVARGYDELLSRHPMDRDWPAVGEASPVPVPAFGSPSGRTRAFLKIQEGCNSFCTYCIIPYGRGPSRSLDPARVIERVRALVGQGFREVVLTATNLGDYASDASHDESPGLGFAELVARILAETGLERLRMSSLDPTEITPRLLEVLEREPRFCPHFHVSLQSPHSRILRLMKRRYGFAEVERCLKAIASLTRAPTGGVFVGMDVITGFPGETRREFEESCQALTELPWHRLHVFPYSERGGTPATRLPGSVPAAERAARARILSELSLCRLRHRHEERLRGGESLEQVLLEKPGRAPRGLPREFQAIPLWRGGYTPNYHRVFVPEHEARLGNDRVSVRPLALCVDSAAGEVAFIGRVVN